MNKRCVGFACIGLLLLGCTGRRVIRGFILNFLRVLEVEEPVTIDLVLLVFLARGEEVAEAPGDA